MSETLTQLGSKTPLPKSPEEAILECFRNPNLKNPVYSIRFSVPEFTSTCPLTSQPDFAKIFIDFVPDELLIESKSLKLFMGSFRNHGAFHEACTGLIFNRLKDAMQPRWLRVAAFWEPRGGIPIDIIITSGEPPKLAQILPLEVPSYRGR